jgi:N-acetylmuramoyl-L-alanine amidase
MKKTSLFILLVIFSLVQSFSLYTTEAKKKSVIIWQPSHQTDTGKDFSEAAVCNAIIEAAMKTKPDLKEFKVWSLGKTEFHHANSGSNTKIEHTSAIVDSKISGYAYELQEANKLHPKVFIAVHNNGGTNRNAVWGYIHYGDKYESDNRELAARLIKAISSVSTLENRGVLLDSTTGRNDYRCQTSGKLSFYSLDENINTAPYRVLLEIGDNAVSRDLLLNPDSQKKIGEAIKLELVAWMKDKNIRY